MTEKISKNLKKKLLKFGFFSYPSNWWTLGHTKATELRLPSCFIWFCALMGTIELNESLLASFSGTSTTTVSLVFLFNPLFAGCCCCSVVIFTGWTVTESWLHLTDPGKWLRIQISTLSGVSQRIELADSKFVSKWILIAVTSIMPTHGIERNRSIKKKKIVNNKLLNLFKNSTFSGLNQVIEIFQSGFNF